jgi:anti-sigma regulatory factor (Ser/Thr protein kinase)
MAPSDPTRVRISLQLAPESVAAGRRAVDALLRAEPPSDFRSKLKLVVSELVTNALTHGSSGKEIQLTLTLYRAHARVRVHNKGPVADLKRFRRGRPGGGRGLDIVAALADGWTIQTGAGGTTITARVHR